MTPVTHTPKTAANSGALALVVTALLVLAVGLFAGQDFPELDSSALSEVITDVDTRTDTLRSSFSGATSPSSPVTGQLWQDTTTTHTKVYDGASWVRLSNEEGSTATTFTLDDDNAGSGANADYRVNRGSTAGDAALRWDESTDEWRALADIDGVTVADFEAAAVQFTSVTASGDVSTSGTLETEQLEVCDWALIDGTLTVGSSINLTTGDVALAAGDVIVTTPTTPASAGATGTVGTIAWDSDYIYICVATDTWKRVAISTW